MVEATDALELVPRTPQLDAVHIRGLHTETDPARDSIDAETFAILLRAHPDMGMDDEEVPHRVLQDVYDVVQSSSARMTQVNGAADTNPSILTTGPAWAVWVPYALLS